MSNLGCEVYAFDPTVNLPAEVNFKFEKLGVADHDQGSYMTLGSILKKNKHEDRKITVLKMDVEGAENKGIPVWINEGSMRNVHQFALEYHLDDCEFAFTQVLKLI